jgi:hypothetical protein
MKLRIRGDSLRLRLTRSEVSELMAGKAVIERMRLGPGAVFEYRLATDAGTAAPRADLDKGALVVRLPVQTASDWANSETVGIEARQANGADQGLLILVEKDFPCLAPRPHEDDSDAFARPGSADPPKCSVE